jgi:hypothetical protein
VLAPQDTDSIVNSLATAIGTVLHIVFIAAYLLLFGVDVVQGFSTFSAAVLALTFVFGGARRGMPGLASASLGVCLLASTRVAPLYFRSLSSAPACCQ